MQVFDLNCIDIVQLNSGAGFNGLLRSGYKSFSGTQDAIIRNINACKELSTIHRTSLGPNGTLFQKDVSYRYVQISN